MKFNFKKVVSVVAMTAMLGSTVAFASAAYPAPFVQNGAADSAIIIGSAVGASDMAAASILKTDLDADVTVTGTTDISGTGDSVKLEKNSVKINLGDVITTVGGTTGVWGTSITSSDLPTLLAEETYRNKNNDEYKYTQKIDLGALNLTHFSDSDLNDRVPTIGYKLDSSSFVANYTIDFKTKPESTDGTDLVDFENTNIKILGKEYYILDFKNSTAKITLLDSAATSTLNEGEEKTLTVGGKSYVVKINFIGTGEVKFDINGETTNKLTTTANTFKLTDGAYVGVREINVQNYAGGSKSVEFSIGKGKLELTDGSAVKMNDKTVTPGDVKAYITKGTSSGKQTLTKIVLEWRLAEKAFLTPGKELVLPGFEAFKFTMADTTMPAKEITAVEYSSDDVLQVKTTIKDGAVTIPILYASTTTGNLTGIGKSATEKLITSNTTELIYNASDSGNRFVVSWANARDAESYYLKASVTQGTDGNLNSTTISKWDGGTTWTAVCTDTTTSIGKCSLGNAELTINSVDYQGSARSINVTVNSGGSFKKLYTKEGLLIYLPWSTNNDTAENGAINLTEADGVGIAGHDVRSFYLYASEEDRNGDLAAGKTFYLTLDTSGTSTYKTSITTVTNAGTQYETKSSSKLWESYIPSELATKVTQDKTNSDQYDAEIEYHGAEVTANLYVAAPTVVSGADASKVQIYVDTEANAVKDKNLIVVGGSCVNSLARMIVDATATAPICGADFTAKTNVVAGGYLIQVAASPLNNGKVAMLVAGYAAADTLAAVNKVNEGNVDTSKNGVTVYPITGTGQ